MITTIIMPVSREDFLQRIFSQLEFLECDSKKTNLLVIVDGSPELFLKARNFTEKSKFANRLCVDFDSKEKVKNIGFVERREKIASIHNFAKQFLSSGDFIFGIEDDTVVPVNALKKLQSDFYIYPGAGFIEGVELGRWGVPYVGAWEFDDVYEPKILKSRMPGTGIEEIDSGGFYCFLTRFDTYKSHEFSPFDNAQMGPDVEFGLNLRKQGYMNYIDWSINCVHLSKQFGKISLGNTIPEQLTFIKTVGGWQQ